MGEYIPAHGDCIMPRKIGVKVDRIVMHTMEGTLRGTLSWFQLGVRGRTLKSLSVRGVVMPTEDEILAASKGVVPTAAHFCIGRDGRVVQMVLETQKCLHAGGYNSRSIGIELEAKAAVDDFPEVMLQAAAGLVADIAKRRGIPLDREHVIGHVEVPGATHTDPGPHFPWGSFMLRATEARAVLG